MKNKIYDPRLSTARDARAQRTRKSLREAMLQLLNAKPLEQITILDITSTAAIGYTTFFRHHPTKESLLNDVAAEQMRRLIDLVLPLAGDQILPPSSTTQTSPTGSQALFSYVDEQRALWSTLLTGGAAGALRDELLRIASEIAVFRSIPDGWPPAEVGVLIAVSGTIELLAWWLRSTDPLSIDEMAEIHNRVVVSPSMQSAMSKRATSTHSREKPKTKSRK